MYKYTPLPSDQQAIRLVTLLRGVGQDDVLLRLTTHEWDPETGIVIPSGVSKLDKSSASVSEFHSTVHPYCDGESNWYRVASAEMKLILICSTRGCRGSSPSYSTCS